MGWDIYTFVDEDWEDDGTIPRPNEDLSTPIISNQAKFKLIDGSNAYITPPITTDNENLSFTWLNDDGTLKEKIEEYMIDNTLLKIETHVTGITFIGKFTRLNPIWLVGQEPDMWKLEATFERME